MTNETKAGPTPGPWHVEPLRGGPSVRTEGGSVIVMSPGIQDVNPMTRAADDANARLIAAAPDLLAALKSCQHTLAMTLDGILAGTVDAGLLRATNEQARAAIAKAGAS